jgi:hypothetical protein
MSDDELATCPWCDGTGRKRCGSCGEQGSCEHWRVLCAQCKGRAMLFQSDVIHISLGGELPMVFDRAAVIRRFENSPTVWGSKDET